tara:strand:- start:3611 stop:4882 length:1272 start_codon:yes stop_codon:yes gene_type:complete
MILLYRVLTFLLYPFLVLLILIRKYYKKEHITRYKEKIFSSHFNVKRKIHSKLIWFHAASIGELKSIIPIIENLEINNNKLEFLITTVTLTSGNLAKNEFANKQNIHHRYFPLDIKFLMQNFLNNWRPSIIFLVDSEIWPNLIYEAKKNKIPISLLNARITKKTYQRWNFFKKTAEKIFKSFDLCLTANLETKNYLINLKASNVYFEGNIKLIQKSASNKVINTYEKELKNKKIWTAISTHEGEEIFCLKSHLILKSKIEEILTIIAPRHIHRANEVRKLCDNLNLSSQILNENDEIMTGKEIIIINSYGKLPNFLKYSKSAFVGKSTIKGLSGEGGQNPMEAAKLGCRVYHGDYIYNFRDIYKILEENNISKKVKNHTELAKNLENDFINTNQEFNKFKIFINDLENKILNNTMEIIRKFIL